jgi:uncharacterized delta-60 repeat protein
MKNIITTSIFIIILFFTPRTSFAQAGSLDVSFGNNGMVTTAVGTVQDEAYSVAIQSDGKVIAAGISANGPIENIALVRYKTNGSLDSTFDFDGKVTTPILDSIHFANALTLQPDGKILIAGVSNFGGGTKKFALLRYLTNGSLDTTFDNDGMVTSMIGLYFDVGTCIAVQTNGKILVGGFSFDGVKNNFALLRFNSDGSLDTSFDMDGKVTTNMGGIDDYARAIAIQNDGKIVLVGNIENGTNTDIAIARYKTNGSLDSTFDSDGKVITSIGNSFDIGYATSIQNDGKIVVAGLSENIPTSSFAVVRYNTNGSLDTSFDGDGIVTTAIGNSTAWASAMAIQPDGKILAVGFAKVIISYQNDFALVRYNTNGSLDNSFDTDGIVTTNFSNHVDQGNSVALQTDGKVVVAGSSYDGNTTSFALSRYLANPVGIIDIPNNNSSISIYPNPFFKMTTLKSEINLEDANLTMFNIYGLKVKNISSITIRAGQTISLAREQLPNGLYFTQIVQDDKIIWWSELVLMD